MKWKVQTGLKSKLYDASKVSVVERNLSLDYTSHKKGQEMYVAAFIKIGKRAESSSKVRIDNLFPSVVPVRKAVRRLAKKRRKKLRGGSARLYSMVWK